MRRPTRLPNPARIAPWRRSLLAVALSCCVATPALAAPDWPAAAYSYYAQDSNLIDVLRQFASGFTLALQAAPGLAGKVDGRFNAASPSQFLDRLGGVYGFAWFVYAGTLFVSPSSDVVSKTVSAEGGSITALGKALKQLGVLDARFGWGEIPDQGIALVTGPAAYVALVQRTVAALALSGQTKQIAVFKLKNASVDDRTYMYRDQRVVVPGVATTLNKLINGSASGPLGVVVDPVNDSMAAQPAGAVAANGAATANGGSATPAAAAAATGAAAAGSDPGRPGSRANIQADSRLNAIIVQDTPERIAMYRQLIQQLDVPSTLIQIEAMIVDVNSDVVDQLGVNWSARAGKASFGSGDTSRGPSSIASAGATGLLGFNLADSFVARIQALQSKGEANILSTPSILTTNNVGAVIDLSDTVYTKLLAERYADLKAVTVGTSLRVTPRYISNPQGAQVELTVDIEDGKVQDRQAGDDLAIRRSNISTLAVVGDDQTLLIGGYNNTQDIKQNNKVPLLGDIPFIGAMFRSTSHEIKRTERLFLIRPHVVSIDGQMVNQQGQLTAQTQLNPLAQTALAGLRGSSAALPPAMQGASRMPLAEAAGPVAIAAPLAPTSVAPFTAAPGAPLYEGAAIAVPWSSADEARARLALRPTGPAVKISS